MYNRTYGKKKTFDIKTNTSGSQCLFSPSGTLMNNSLIMHSILMLTILSMNGYVII